MARIANILVVILLFFTASVSPARGVEVGGALPDFALQTFDGNHSSRASLNGKPLLLIFWNTWCPNCMRELPEVNRLAEKFVPRGLAVLAINTAINDSESKARTYWEKQGYAFPTGFDKYFEIGQDFKVRGVPTIFLIDSKGVVQYKQARLPEDVEGRLEQLLEKGKPQ
jgi:thiol-disulfide isomerase/thioredoxin